MKTLRLILMTVISAALLLSGCTPEEAIEKALPSRSTVIGDWQMTRISISPEAPVPDIIVGMFLSGKPLWKITGNADTGLASRISFEGRDIWFKIPSLGVQGSSVEAVPRVIREESSSRLVTSGGGTIKVSRVSLIGLPEFTDVVVNYQDTVTMKFNYSNGGDTVEAIITVQATGGSYKMDGETGQITPYSATIEYTGTRR